MDNPPPLEPIPSPTHNVWREIRVNILPVIAFLGITVSVVALWMHYVSAPSVQAEVEAIRANVISTQPGTLVDVKVKRFDVVKAGDPVARVSVLDSDTAKADLAVVLADLRVLQARMTQDQTRNELNFVQLRLSLVTAQVELAMAKVRLRQAETEFQRVEQMFQQKVIQAGVSLTGEAGYEVALRDRDSLRDEVAGKTKLVAATEEALKQFAVDDPARTAAILQDPINKAIAANEEKFRILQNPVTLKAPIDGVVSVVAKSAGEKAIAGEPIMTVSSIRSERIVGYVRLPINTEPKVGMPCKIMTKGSRRQVITATITTVGGDIELFAATLRTRGLAAAQERGLPFAIDLPKDKPLRVRPGEIVDVVFLK